MEQDEAYRPIACDFHDRLEAFATLRRRVRLTLKDEDAVGEEASAEGLIADIYTREDKKEFLRLDTGEEIRLDRILDVAPAADSPH
jgi:transcriptional antiterminator Rof (Rho-off)